MNKGFIPLSLILLTINTSCYFGSDLKLIKNKLVYSSELSRFYLKLNNSLKITITVRLSSKR
jgi:hypothetical protein